MTDPFGRPTLVSPAQAPYGAAPASQLAPAQVQPSPAESQPASAPQRNDGVRGLLAIAFGWTVVTVFAVVGIGIVRPPMTPDIGWDPFGGFGGGQPWENYEDPPAGIDLEDPAFRILSVNGQPADRVDEPLYAVQSPTAVVELEVLKDEEVDCWTEETDDYQTVAPGPGTQTVRIDLVEGSNMLACGSYGPIGQFDLFEVVYTRAAPSARVGPTPKPTPDPSSIVTFATGKTLTVGSDVQPGTYRTRTPEPRCFWERRTPDGNVKATVRGYAVVEIADTDTAFVSDGCIEWSSDLSAVTGSTTDVGEGTFIVGTDLLPGTWTATPPNPAACTWARLRGFSGEESETIQAGEVGAAHVVVINEADAGFTSMGCGRWVRR